MVIASEPSESGSQCLVCMRPAHGMHYHVPTCHGCKSFFRRTIVHKTVHPKCWRNEKCYSNLSLSSKLPNCRACRYQKCFDVGMIAQIGTERKNNLQEIREKPHHAQEVQIETRIEVHDSMLKMESFINYLSLLDKQLLKIRKSKFNPFIYPSLQQLIESPSQLGYASKFEPMPGWPLDRLDFYQKQKQITSSKIMIENEKLDEATTTMADINTKEWPPFEILLAIEYIKTFPFFEKLSLSDKLCLARGTAFIIYVTTSAFNSYQLHKDTLITPDGIVITEASIKAFVENHSAPNENKCFGKKMFWKFVLRIMEPLLRDKFEYSEYVLLKAIIVTNPALDLSQEGQKIVQNERNKYARALLDLCLLNYGNVNGPSRFLIVISYINVMEDYQKFFREFMTIAQLFKPAQVSKSRRKLENDVLCIEIE